MKNPLILVILASLSSCAFVSQIDLDKWKGQPVSKLDSHSFFLTVPMETKNLGNGKEVRNYRNGGAHTVSASCNWGVCNGVASEVVCNNIFYIQDGIVTEYRPVGRCRTDSTLWPED